MKANVKQGRMNAQTRSAVANVAENAIVRPINDLPTAIENLDTWAAWLDRLVGMTYAQGLAIPLAHSNIGLADNLEDMTEWTVDSLVALNWSGWSDGTARTQHTVRLFWTREIDNIVTKADNAQWKVAQRIARAMNHIRRTKRAPKDLVDARDDLINLAHTEKTVGTLTWFTIPTFNLKDGEPLPQSRQTITSYGVAWRGKLTYASGMKLPVGKAASHFRVAREKGRITDEWFDTEQAVI